MLTESLARNGLRNGILGVHLDLETSALQTKNCLYHTGRYNIKRGDAALALGILG